MKNRTKIIIRWGILILAACFIILGIVGIVAEEPVLVLQKAVRVCLECIGIG